jgi:2-amino-4-hydroxy-6-hydroxymethyldihydropteridine diphosphokinase
MHTVYLGLGSNLGDRHSLIRQAVALLGQRVGEVVRQSSLMETEPWGFRSDHKFLNCVVLCHTVLTPRQTLEVTKQIERDLGRIRPATGLSAPGRRCCGTQKRVYTDRPIDIDILLYDHLCVDEPDLKIPHPLMQERDFVMKPLREIYQE